VVSKNATAISESKQNTLYIRTSIHRTVEMKNFEIKVTYWMCIKISVFINISKRGRILNGTNAANSSVLFDLLIDKKGECWDTLYTV
jgi:hypothetical protein